MPIDLPEANVTECRAALFRNGRNQAVWIPREFEMEGTEVLMRKEGDRLIYFHIDSILDTMCK